MEFIRCGYDEGFDMKVDIKIADKDDFFIIKNFIHWMACFFSDYIRFIWIAWICICCVYCSNLSGSDYACYGMEYVDGKAE